MTIGIDTNALIAYYQAKAGILSTGTGSGSATTSSSTPAAPTPPWTQTPTATQVSATVQAALSGQSIINPSTSKLTATSSGLSAATTANYNSLFTLYQGLNSLTDLANQAAQPNQTSFQLSQLQNAFASGLSQIQSYLGSSPFSGFDVALGAAAAQQNSGSGAPAETDTYTTGTVFSGSANTPVPALSGDVSFTAIVTSKYGAPKTVNFNLADMGSTPRTLGNVVNYMNAQLKAAHVATTIQVVDRPGAAQTLKLANGQTLTLPTGPDQLSLKIVGNSLETLTLSAPTQTPAVYLTQTAGLPAPAASTTTSATSTTSTTSSTPATPPGTSLATQQLLKLDPSSATPRVFTDALGNQVTNVSATAVAPDGSVYVLGNINGPTSAGEISASQQINGTQDVALLKYDSAGNLLTTNVLGAAASASGLSLAVSSDGSQIAVAGTVTGALTTNVLTTGASAGTVSVVNGKVVVATANTLGSTTTATDSTVPTSFVSVFDSSGDPVWTARQNSTLGDQVNSVAFGANGAVYVGGTTSSSLTGQALTGQTAAYLTGYSAKGVQTFTTQFGGASQNAVNGVAVSGSTIITAGIENGDAVVRSYTIPASGAPTLAATRDLGPIQGGSVAGVSINSDGSVIVAGSTHNGALNAGTVTTPYVSGQEAFIAKLSPDLAASSSDALTYYKGSGDTTASAVTTSGGQVYIAGQVKVAPTGGETTANDGYVAQIDPTTGAVTWSNVIASANNESAPHGIAVDPTGSSVLDLLGLPSGTINNQPNQAIVANSSVNAGDQFTVTTFGVPRTITVTAQDTLATLATKIQQASSYQATATVIPTIGGQVLQIAPSNPGAQVSLGDGPGGQDALPGLGLKSGVITDITIIQSKTSTLNTNYGLGLSSTLNLNSTADIAAAQAALRSATGAVSTIYLGLSTPPKPATGNNSTSNAVPAYLTAEIANYQAGLNRLTGGSTSSTSSLASLFGA